MYMPYGTKIGASPYFIKKLVLL